MSSISPGPWEWWEVGIDEEVMLIPKGREKTTDDAVLTLGWVSCGDGTRGKEPSLADMNLIAAAPDMLEALQDMLDHAQRGLAHVGSMSKARAAVLKATGETDGP